MREADLEMDGHVSFRLAGLSMTGHIVGIYPSVGTVDVLTDRGIPSRYAFRADDLSPVVLDGPESVVAVKTYDVRNRERTVSKLTRP